MSSEPNILIVDDEESHADATAESLERKGYRCMIATSGREGIEKIREHNFDLVITDLVMSKVGGMEILKAAKQANPDTIVIVITGYGTIESAVDAMKQGANDYIPKPINIDDLRIRVQKALENQMIARNNIELRKQLDKKFGFEGIIGNSPKMQRIFDQLSQISAADVTVLISGESGTGKELIAKAIHNNSPRKKYHFVALNCASFSEGVLESELFGHEKGAFTHAISMRKGRFEHANHGTLFLDEVGDMPLTMQVKLLRVIEEREIVRIGSNESIPIDVRLIAATNQDIRKLVDEGKFRSDLLFRLDVVHIKVPPLRERRDDIPLLVDAFIQEFCQLHNKRVSSITPEVRGILNEYDWPGNVRELKNCIESMIVLTKDEILGTDDLPESLLDSISPEKLTHAPTSHTPRTIGVVAGTSLEEVEKELIRKTLDMTNGNREETAKLLGIGERTLYRKLKKYKLS